MDEKANEVSTQAGEMDWKAFLQEQKALFDAQTQANKDMMAKVAETQRLMEEKLQQLTDSPAEEPGESEKTDKKPTPRERVNQRLANVTQIQPTKPVTELETQLMIDPENMQQRIEDYVEAYLMRDDGPLSRILPGDENK